MSDDVKREIGELLADQLPSDDDPAAYFHGHEPRECGEHRTVGSHRAWCYSCSEWCYPRIEAACSGCMVPALQAQRDQARGMVVELEGENAKLLAEHEPLRRENESVWTQAEGYLTQVFELRAERDALEAERDAALLAAEVATGTPCWRCGGAA